MKASSTLTKVVDLFRRSAVHRHWIHVNADGTQGTPFDWPIGGSVLQSPDGRHLVYVEDVLGGARRLVVRDTASGPARPITAGDRSAFRWTDPDHVLVDPVGEHGAIHLIDIRDGADAVIFRPPPPPVANPAGAEGDYWDLSGDLRWAVLWQSVYDRTSDVETRVGHWLYDRDRATYVGTLDQPYLLLSPVGDLAVWIEGTVIRAMHLCDRRAVTLGSVSTGEVRGTTWSADGRFLSLYFG